MFRPFVPPSIEFYRHYTMSCSYKSAVMFFLAKIKSCFKLYTIGVQLQLCSLIIS